jgi:hypothetical protein
MRVYPRSATRWFVCYIVAIAPAGDADFVRIAHDLVAERSRREAMTISPRLGDEHLHCRCELESYEVLSLRETRPGPGERQPGEM